jgi:putative transposase
MNREVHVRFWESAELRCSAPLTYLHAYTSVTEAKAGIGAWLTFYNEERLHQTHGYRTPRQVYETQCRWTGGRPSGQARGLAPTGSTSPACAGSRERLAFVPMPAGTNKDLAIEDGVITLRLTPMPRIGSAS